MGVKLNGYDPWVALYNVALWDRTGMKFSFNDGDLNVGGTGVQQDQKGRIQVESQRMDAVLKPNVDVFFMKMDCEGCEPHALLSFDTLLLNRKVKHIVIETHHKAVNMLEVFYMLGYTCNIFDERKDCKFPNIEAHCRFPTFDSAVKAFQTRKPYQCGDYMDFHCELTQEPPVALDTLRSALKLEGKLVKCDMLDEYYRIENGLRVLASSQTVTANAPVTKIK
eukprot:gene46888-58480_t